MAGKFRTCLRTPEALRIRIRTLLKLCRLKSKYYKFLKEYKKNQQNVFLLIFVKACSKLHDVLIKKCVADKAEINKRCIENNNSMRERGHFNEL